MRNPLTRRHHFGYHNDCKVMQFVVASTEANTMRAANLSFEIIGPRQKTSKGPE